MKTRFIRRVLPLVLLVLSGARDSAPAQTLNVPQIYQEKDQWCWAAVSRAILSYYGRQYSQTTIAQYGAGGHNTWNYCWGTGTEGGIFRRGIDLILSYYGGISSTGYAYSLGQSTCQTEINALRPLVVNWTWDSGGGHFVVMRGLSGNTAYLMDPFYGPTVNTFSWVVQGGGHRWTHSLKLHTAPSTGPWGGSDAGGGWKWSSWFGYYLQVNSNWIWHQQHEYLYSSSTSSSSIWFWYPDLNTWCWTSSSTYPYIWTMADGWYWYKKGSANPRWFMWLANYQWYGMY